MSSVPSSVRVMPRQSPDHMSHPAAAFLLAVDEVALGEHRAARGDRRRVRDCGGSSSTVLVRNAQPARLLVEERPRARGAQRVGRVALELALAVELDERGRPAADVHDGERVGRKLPNGVDLAERHVAGTALAVAPRRTRRCSPSGRPVRPAGRPAGPAPPPGRRPARPGAARTHSPRSGPRHPRGRPSDRARRCRHRFSS